MKIRLKWWETSVTLNRAKTLPGISDAQRQALSGKIDSLGSKSNYLNSEPSYVSHGFFRRAPEVLMRSLPAFRANCYTSYSLVDDTVKLYTLLQYVGNQMSSDPPADWLLAYEAASRRLVDNVEILRTVSACDTYIQLIFWEILHEVMWASRILTCQRLVALRNCADGSSGSSDDQSRHFWDSLCTLKAERRLCDSILVKQLLRRGEDAGSCELLLAGRFPEDNLHLLGCVLRCEDFKSEDPKPTGFLGRLEDYPTWSSPILTILGDLDARALNDEELVLSKLPVMEKEESLLPKQEREILALVRGEDFMAYHEKLQDAWDVCSAHITEYESGFGGSQFPSLDEESLLSTIKFTRDDQEITESKIDIPGKGPAKIRIDRDYVLGTGHNQSLTLRNIPADKLSLTGKLGEAVDTNRKEGPTESLWSRVGEDLEGSDSAMEIIDYFDDDGIPEPLP
ncbi:hypothetical protein V865_005345 [Kwoniella europaea PYCC6329]|uniref:ELYS-like domain-containing protein n=1 Tax=Kwoniella europaea PYCC6329 TaxID=1423913 RepID=A0AAX4KNF2_9TREE